MERRTFALHKKRLRKFRTNIDMSLPQDPMMLFSYVNTKLRDDYSSLDALCDDLDVDKQQLEQKMADAGFEYNPSQNKFW